MMMMNGCVAFVEGYFKGHIFKLSVYSARVIERDKAIHSNGFDEEHLKVPLLEDDVKRLFFSASAVRLTRSHALPEECSLKSLEPRRAG